MAINIGIRLILTYYSGGFSVACGSGKEKLLFLLADYIKEEQFVVELNFNLQSSKVLFDSETT